MAYGHGEWRWPKSVAIKTTRAGSQICVDARRRTQGECRYSITALFVVVSALACTGGKSKECRAPPLHA